MNTISINRQTFLGREYVCCRVHTSKGYDISHMIRVDYTARNINKQITRMIDLYCEGDAVNTAVSVEGFND